MPDPADWVAFALLPGLGPILQRRALERFGGNPAEIAYRVPARAFAELGLRLEGGVAEIDAARKRLRRQAEDEVRRCRRAGVRLVPAGDPDYPAPLAQIPDPPILLWMRGALGPALRFAVVGSRRASGYGRRVAAGLAMGLATRGIEVVSGGARGIDTAAHTGALEAEGRTVAVLGSGLAVPYPAENAALFERIAESGALLSESPLDARPHVGAFPRRNRLISGLSAAVVVVEAAAKSGSLITAAHALEQGREVLAVPGAVENPRAEGCHRLIQQGAKLVHCIEDILDELPPEYRGAVGPDAAETPVFRPESLTSDERALWDLLDPVKPLHLDELADEALFGIPRLQVALFGLELNGAVEKLPGGYYLRRHQGPSEA